jgi:hypothetical protein
VDILPNLPWYFSVQFLIPETEQFPPIVESEEIELGQIDKFFVWVRTLIYLTIDTHLVTEYIFPPMLGVIALIYYAWGMVKHFPV